MTGPQNAAHPGDPQIVRFSDLSFTLCTHLQGATFDEVIPCPVTPYAIAEKNTGPPMSHRIATVAKAIKRAARTSPAMAGTGC